MTLCLVADSFQDAAKLLVGLVEESVSEVRVNGGAAGSFEQALKVFHFLREKLAVGEQLVSANQRDGTIQLEQHFERVGDVCLCLAFEKAFVSALAQTRGGVHCVSVSFALICR
jgi:hypothetical protein